MQAQDQPFLKLIGMSRWYVVSRAIHTLAQLGLANHLDKPRDVIYLAQACDCLPEPLDRLLKFLTAYDLFTYNNNLYSLTELSMPLRDDHPQSIRDLLCIVDDTWWQAFSHLEIPLKTNKPAFNYQHGESFFSFLANHPDKQNTFYKGISRLASFHEQKISKAFNFSALKSLTDLSTRTSNLMEVISTDHPSVEVSTLNFIPKLNEFNSSDFPPLPPSNGYMFKGVLHDYQDDRLNIILTTCAAQMPKNASLFISEPIIPDSDAPHPNKTMDIIMMVLIGGKQRTLREWCEVFNRAGFAFQGNYNTETLFALMEFKPK